jgi:hypothetical protein
LCRIEIDGATRNAIALDSRGQPLEKSWRSSFTRCLLVSMLIGFTLVI